MATTTSTSTNCSQRNGLLCVSNKNGAKKICAYININFTRYRSGIYFEQNSSNDKSVLLNAAPQKKSHTHKTKNKKQRGVRRLTGHAAHAPVEAKPLHRIPSEGDHQANHRNGRPTRPRSPRSLHGNVLAPDHSVRLALDLSPCACI